MTLNLKNGKVLEKLQKNSDFICSVFDEESFIKAKKIGIDAIKVASSDLTDYKLFSILKKINPLYFQQVWAL